MFENEIRNIEEVVEPHDVVCTTISRGAYGEISVIAGKSPTDIIARYSKVLPERFAEFDKKMRGDALNLDLYGYDEGQGVAVIQIRHAFRKFRKSFMATHKDYVLVGTNEIGTMFRHPVSAHAVRAGIRANPLDPVSAVRAAQKWMWKVTDKQLAASVRQGDVLIVPSRITPVNQYDEAAVILGGSHVIRADRFGAKGERLFALNPTLEHTKEQHAPVTLKGWHSVRLAEAASTWSWGVRLGD